jgi:hypothetical protein
VKGSKKICQSNDPGKQAGVAILISDKVDFKLTLVKRRTLHTNKRSKTSKGNNN